MTSPNRQLSAAKRLLVFHVTLVVWWLMQQGYYRVVLRKWPDADATLFIGAVALALIAVSTLLTIDFARVSAGTRAATFAWAAVACVVIDLVAETAVYLPKLGLPGLTVAGASGATYALRLTWATIEFGTRGAMWLAMAATLRASPRGAQLTFFSLLGLHWVVTALQFAAGTEVMPAAFSDSVVVQQLIRLVPTPAGFGWLLLLTWLIRQVTIEFNEATTTPSNRPASPR